MYHCQWFASGCVEVAQQKLPPEDGIGAFVNSEATSAEVLMWVDATHPLSFAPAINGWVAWDLRPGGTTVVGTHDLMPVHQLWWGNQDAHAYLVYQNWFYNPACLFGEALPSPCTGYINARL